MFFFFCSVPRAKGNGFQALGLMCRRCIAVDILSDLQTLFHIEIFQDVQCRKIFMCILCIILKCIYLKGITESFCFHCEHLGKVKCFCKEKDTHYDKLYIYHSTR